MAKRADIRNSIDRYIKDQYGAEPEYPWPKYNQHAVYRHQDNKKWFALIMEVDRDKLAYLIKFDTVKTPRMISFRVKLTVEEKP